MQAFWRSIAIVAITVLSPVAALAQCEAVAMVPDGRTYVIDSSVTPTYGWFYLVLGRSYSIEVTPPDGVTGVTPFAPVINDAVNCPTTTSAAGVVSTTVNEPRVNQGARWAIIGTNPSTVALRVRVVGQRFKASVSETTLFNPSWSTYGSFASQWSLQNTSSTALTGVLTLSESLGGTTVYTKSITLPANSTTFVTTADQFVNGPVAANRGGSATFAHVGPPGSVLGDAYLMGPNLSMIVPSIFKTARESGR